MDFSLVMLLVFAVAFGSVLLVLKRTFERPAVRAPHVSSPAQSSQPPPPVPSSFSSRQTLFSKAERSFYGVLQSQLGGKFVVFAKVRLADLVRPDGPQGSSWWTAFNQVSGKHIDFVVCHLDTLDFVCCVELDDASHSKQDRRERDAFVDRCLGTAGIPVLRIPAARSYSANQIYEKILLTIGARTG